MKNNSDSLRIIIQLILGAVVYYVFTFKYKEVLIDILSLQVYYQALVIVVITNSYVAKWITQLIEFSRHLCMMKLSVKYKTRHFKEKRDLLLEKSKSAKLSEQAKKMVDGLSESDFELETELSLLYEEVNKIKTQKK